jgi:hypothetical protein
MAIPRRELVGKNATVKNGIYSDEYLKALNNFATVDEVFGYYRKQIASGGNAVGRLVMGTLGRTGWENHLVSLVMVAASVGEWRAVLREKHHNSGQEAVVDKNFGYFVDLGEKRFLLPSAHYISYCQAQLEEASPIEARAKKR